jgi:hypothetical protein
VGTTLKRPTNKQTNKQITKHKLSKMKNKEEKNNKRLFNFGLENLVSFLQSNKL